MNWLDFLLLIPISYGLLRGILKGFILEVFSLLGIFFGVIAARIYSDAVAINIKNWFDIEMSFAQPLAFIVIFIVIAISFHILAIIISKILKIILLGWLNKLLGGVFGLCKMLIIMSIFINLFHLVNIKKEIIATHTISCSLLYEPIKKIIPVIAPQFFTQNETD